MKELRKGKYTQADMAQLLGVGRTTYTKYESGDIQLSADVLNRLSDIFDVSINYILGDDNPINTGTAYLNAAETDVINLFRELNDTGQRLVSDYCNMLVANPDFRKDQSSASAM